MTKVRARGEDVRKFILENIENFPSDIAKHAADHFGVSRQAINQHLKKMVLEKCLAESGKTRSKLYKLASLAEWVKLYKIEPGLAEDVIWREDIQKHLGALPDNVKDIWHFAFTEMFNNAIDHSGGTLIDVSIHKTASYAELIIHDDGLGIFKKIQSEMNLLDERHAVLELAKGKLTTDPKHHSGEGIFFTSRMVDSFDILSGGVFFTHLFDKQEDWLLERSNASTGTTVFLKLHNHTARTLKKIYAQFSAGEDFGFNKTVVPVALAQYGNDKLISRSQAKRLLARVELFKVVIFDFKGVEVIGQAFADEIFRVFAAAHPELELVAMNATTDVQQMVVRAQAAQAAQ